MASPTSPDDIHGIACPRCTDKTHKICTACKSIAYCSLECQEADWPLHKILCSKFKDFSDDQRPRDDMRRVVVFHPDEDSPRLMWAPVVSPDGYEVLASDSVAITDPNGDQVKCQDLRLMRLLTNDRTGKELPHPIHMLVDDHSVGNYTCENRAVPVATERMRRYLWLGPLIAYSSKYFPENDPDEGENEEEVVKIQDLTMRDYADIVAWLVHFPIDWRIVLGRRGKVDCVRISSDGDERSGGKLSLQPVRVPRSHPIFDGNAPVLEVSKVSQSNAMIRGFQLTLTSARGHASTRSCLRHFQARCSSGEYHSPALALRLQHNVHLWPFGH